MEVMDITYNMTYHHDDVIKWKHFPRYWPYVRGIHRSTVNSPHKDQWRGALMLPSICAWINDWANNREADDLRRHRAHYDFTVTMMVRNTTCPLSMLDKGNWDQFRFKDRPSEYCDFHYKHTTVVIMSYLYNENPYTDNTSRPDDANIRQWTGSSLVQLMFCRIFRAKLLPDLTLMYNRLDKIQCSSNQTTKILQFHSR